MRLHNTRVGRGSAGKYLVTCSACDFNPEWTASRADAERWAAEHQAHPNRDVSGIWTWDRWRVIDGMNHAFPFNTAACGAGSDGTGPDPDLPLCPLCEEHAPADRVKA